MMKPLLLIFCLTGFLTCCSDKPNQMNNIDASWAKLTAAQNDTEELAVLEQLRVFLRKKEIACKITDENGNDLATTNNSAPVSSVTIRFYLKDGSIVNKSGWKPKKPENAFYLFNE